MGRTARHNLDPAHVLADAAALAATDLTLHIDLKAGFHKGEEARAHSHRHIRTEHFAQDALYHHFAGSEGNILVHDQRFILEERPLMMGIRRLIQVNPPRIHKTVRGLVGLHVADASAGQVGTQAELLVGASAVMPRDPVGIHALPGRMVRREIQLVKSVQLTGNLVLLKDLKPHRPERVVQIVAHLGNGMEAAAGGHDARNRTVKVRGNLGCLQL